MTPKRFRIAFSFTGDRRGFVAEVATLLAEQFHADQILYDKYHEAEFARNDLGIYLPNLYNEHADLIVAVVCPKYDAKEWTGLEWLAIHDLLQQGEREKVLLSRFDKSKVDGLFRGAGFIELDDKTPAQFAVLILERLALNEGHPRDHYTKLSGTQRTSTASPPSNLPGIYIGQPFVGREQFLKDVRASLSKQTHATAITAATVVEGLGGLGKTHAAVEYAHQHRGDYTALLFASGDSSQRLQTSLAALCEVPGLHLSDGLPPDEAARAGIALNWLATHHDWLLIIDNVDDEASAQALTALFEQLRSGHVLITSRLKIWPRQVEALDLSVLSPDDATALLLQLTDQHRRKASDDADQARTLALLMDGLPLALHQAAGYINEQSCTLAKYHATYQQEAAELLNWFNSLSISYERPDKLAPRPVLITWKTSFDQLSAESRRWLLVFSHFAPESIPEFLLDDKPNAKDAAKTRHRAARQALAEAGKCCLITRSKDDPPRFKLHRLVQEVTRLSASAEECATALDLGIRLIAESEPGNPEDVRTWKQWNPLQPHAAALCQHAPDEHGPEGLTWLLNQSSLLLQTKSLHAQAEPLMRRALQIDEASYGPEHPNVAIRLNNLAQLLQATNRLAEAEPLMRRALEIDEASFGPEHPNVAIRLNNLAPLLQDTNRKAEHQTHIPTL